MSLKELFVDEKHIFTELFNVYNNHLKNTK
jgi:hypothetical protein